MLPLVVVTGPTATGKTKLAVQLALRYGGEVVSCDSMQIYRGMDIGTAKPTPEEMRGVPHHLVDFVEPSQRFSVADYAPLARAAIVDIAARGRLPILAGGSGLYLSAVVDGIRFSEEAPVDEALRARLNERVKTEGGAVLLRELAGVDPEYAARLHENNVKRIVRALEVYAATGRTMTQAVADSRFDPGYRLCMLGLTCADRGALYARTDARVGQMLEAGLAEEVRALLASGVPRGATALQAIGYKELAGYLGGEATLEEAADDIRRETRRYVKRQLTWLRRDPRISWLDVGALSPEEIFSRACAAVDKFLRV